MTDLGRIQERMEKGGVIFLTSFFNLFMIKIGALVGPAFITGVLYYEGTELNGLTIFLLIMGAISIVWSLYFLLTTGSVILKGQTLIIKKNFRRTRKVNIHEIEGVSERFISRSLSSSGTRITRINYPGNNGKSTYVLIFEGRSLFSIPKPSVIDVLGLAGWMG